jgi:hypothetical protein
MESSQLAAQAAELWPWWPLLVPALLTVVALRATMRLSADTRMVERLAHHPDSAVYEQELAPTRRALARVSRLVSGGSFKRTARGTLALNHAAWARVRRREALSLTLLWSASAVALLAAGALIGAQSG